ncbi:MAG: DUF1838 family protein [Vicinamibacterales bacterium]|nr:DUF1838 family protein [Vicinamibacterales bacterium]
MNMPIVRRTLSGGLAAALCLTLGASLAAQQRLDLKNPDDAVKAMRKFQSSLVDGKPVFYWWQGSIYSRVPGEKDRLLFTYQGMNVRASTTLVEPGRGYGYRQVSREILIYLDPATQQVLRTWKNPWTGKENEIVHVANDPVNSRPMFAQGPGGPMKWPGFFKDGQGFLAMEIPLFYTNPMGGDYQPYVGNDYQAMEIFNFFFPESQLLDANTDMPDVAVSWARISGWLPWMEMGSRVGQMIYNGVGRRLDSWDALPEVLKAEIKANYPEYQVPPSVGDTRPNETSWTYFKKMVDKKRAAAKPPVK